MKVIGIIALVILLFIVFVLIVGGIDALVKESAYRRYMEDVPVGDEEFYRRR